MKNKLILGLLVVFIGSMVSSCSTSNSVVGKYGIQKRKYTKGYSVSSNKHLSSTKKSNKTNLAVVNDELSAKEVNNSVVEYSKATSKETILIDEAVSELESSQVRTVDTKKINNKQLNKSNTEESLTILKAEKVNNSTINKVKQKASKIADKVKVPAGTDAMTIILVILAIVIPPLAVFLYEEASKRFWIDLILAILGWGFLGWFLPSLIYLGSLAAVIYALLIVLGVI